MTKGKKYDYRVVQSDSGWTAEITRRMTAKKTVVSKKQGGFVTESEAEEWGAKELETFAENLKQRNMRHSVQRKPKTDKE